MRRDVAIGGKPVVGCSPDFEWVRPFPTVSSRGILSCFHVPRAATDTILSNGLAGL